MSARKTAINSKVLHSSWCAIVPKIKIYIETFIYLIHPNNIKLKCVKIISPVSL
jgi:hypothetical protein